MSQTRYFIRAAKLQADLVYGRLEAAFEEEGAPLAITEIDEKTKLYEVSAYLEEENGEREADFRQALGDAAGTLSVEREVLPDIDWVSQVLADLKPVRAGRFVVHGAHDRGLVRPSDIAIEIEAGRAFGTGHHGTTSGCLEMIEAVAGRKRPTSALDLGTGSAVLAIALAKLTCCPVIATDIDPVAVAVARDNIRNNHAHGLVETAVATGFRSAAIRRRKPFDLIAANILAGPLMKLAPAMRRHLTPGGDVILSGILERQRWPVLAAYRLQGLFHVKTLQRDEWVTLHLRAERL